MAPDWLSMAQKVPSLDSNEVTKKGRPAHQSTPPSPIPPSHRALGRAGEDGYSRRNATCRQRPAVFLKPTRKGNEFAQLRQMARGPPDAPGRAAERAGQKPRRVGRPGPSGEHSPLSVAPPRPCLSPPITLALIRVLISSAGATPELPGRSFGPPHSCRR